MTGRPHGIILIVMDTVRPDHLNCYGYERPTSPFLSSLLKEAVVFRWAFSPSSYTLPVHASLFTGKLPSRHSAGFDQATGRLDRDKEITLAELLSAAGYRTAAFVSALPLRKETGLNAGFEVYDDEMTSGELNRPQELFRNGNETNERVFRWLSENYSNKFFIFCHYFDAHGPYENPEPYASLFVGDALYRNGNPRLLEVVGDGKQGGIPAYQVLRPLRDEAGSLLSYERDVRYYLAQYDAGIRRVDDCIAGLVSNLKALGIYDESLLIVTADHGEALGENNVWFFHGLTVTPEQIHVPLIMKLPKGYPLASKSGTVDCPVSLLDLMPTILDMVGVEHASLHLDGKSLLPALRDGKWEEMSQRRLLSENAGQYAVITWESIQVKPKPSPECSAAQGSNFLGCLYAPEVWARSVVDSYREAEEGATSAPPITWTGERYVPWVDLGTPEIHYEHLHRYYFALQFVEGKKVLDLASGEGYGCAILAEKAAQVVGVEIDEKAVKHAASKYPLPNLEFIQGSITDVPIPGAGIFDVITCFEAIEHIAEHEKLLTEVKRLLKDDGLFIISSPNKLTYSDQPGYRNPYHVKELYFDEFKDLLTKYFPHVRFLGQKVFPVSAIWPLGAQEGSFTETCVRTAEAGFVRAGVQEKVPLYFIAVGSTRPLLEQVVFSTLTDVSEAMFRRLRELAAEKDQLLGQKENELKSLREKATEQEEAIRAGERLLEQTRQEMDAALRASEEALAAKERGFAAERESLRSIIAQSEQRIAELEDSLSEFTKQLAEKDIQILLIRSSLETQVSEKQRIIAQLEDSFNKLRKELAEKEKEIFLIYSSLGWHLIQKYRKVMDRIFPPYSSRRRFYELIQRALKIALTEGPFVLGWKAARKVTTYYGTQRKRCIRDDQPDKESSQEYRVPALYGPFYIGPFHTDVISTRVSVIIPVKNAGPEFEDILKKIRFQRGIKEIEIVVIDSGSTDGSLEIARLWADTVLTVDPKDFNHGATRNLGAERARGDILIFTVQDAIPIGDYWLKNLVQPLLHLPQVAAVSCRQIPRSDADAFACWAINNHYQSLRLFQDEIFTADEQYWKAENPLEKRRRANLDNVCSAIRRVALEKEPFKPMRYAEDLELGLRLLRAGWSIGFLSSVGVIHSHNRSPFYFLKRSCLDSKVLRSLLEPCFSTDLAVANVGDLVFTLSHLNVQLKAWATLFNVKEVSCDYVTQKLNEALTHFDASTRDGKTSEFLDDLLIDGELENFLKELKNTVLESPALYLEAVRSDLLGRSYQFLDYLFHTRVSPEIGQVASGIYKIFAVVMGEWLSRTVLPERIVFALEQGV